MNINGTTKRNSGKRHRSDVNRDRTSLPGFLPLDADFEFSTQSGPYVGRASIPGFLELGEFEVTARAYPLCDCLVKINDFKVRWGDMPVDS